MGKEDQEGNPGTFLVLYVLLPSMKSFQASQKKKEDQETRTKNNLHQPLPATSRQVAMEDASILQLPYPYGWYPALATDGAVEMADHRRRPVKNAACDVDTRLALGGLGRARQSRGWTLLAESALWITDE